MNALKRFMSKVHKTDSCWFWMAGKNGNGYGYFWFENASVPAHRWIYCFFNGRLGYDIELHHKCQTPTCVNPDHLQPLTPSEHIKKHGMTFWQSNKTTCPNGHPYSGNNLYVCRKKRYCRICRRLYFRKYYHSVLKLKDH